MTAGHELPRLVLRALLLTLVAAAALLLAHGSVERTQRSADFQRAVGGVGLGVAADLTGDPAAFDARLGRPPMTPCHGPLVASGWLEAPPPSPGR